MSSVKGYFLEALGKVVPVAPTLISTVLSPVKSGVPLAYEVHVSLSFKRHCIIFVAPIILFSKSLLYNVGKFDVVISILYKLFSS